MAKIVNTSNTVLSGVVGEITYSHTVHVTDRQGKRAGQHNYYRSTLMVMRKSGAYDVIPLVMSEYIMEQMKEGDYAEVSGEFRSRNYNSDEDGRRHLALFVYVVNVIPTEPFADDCNNIEIVGYVTNKKPLRTTPFGKNITDFMIAVNRGDVNGGKRISTSYLPCIAWGSSARWFDEHCETGMIVKATGRLQSRLYRKTDAEGNVTSHTAYEVSCSWIEILDEGEE